VRSYDLAPPPPPPPRPIPTSVSWTGNRSKGRKREFADGRGVEKGELAWEEPNHATARKPGLFKTINTLWLSLVTVNHNRNLPDLRHISGESRFFSKIRPQLYSLRTYQTLPTPTHRQGKHHSIFKGPILYICKHCS
jgi:hypothetical protein